MSQDGTDPRQASRMTLSRFVRRTAVLAAFGLLESALGRPGALSWLFAVAGLICFGQALARRERPFDPWLNHWDEAGWFGLAACLT
jgi:hypothetical protein